MKKCIYLTEGECEEKLIRALKERPSLVLPGKVKKFNVIQNELPVSLLMQFDPGSIVVLIFDTDKDETSHLRKNIALLKSLSFKVEILTILQVLNFEDEIARATDVSKAQDLTRSKTINDFKSAVNRMNELEIASYKLQPEYMKKLQKVISAKKYFLFKKAEMRFHSKELRRQQGRGAPGAHHNPNNQTTKR